MKIKVKDILDAIDKNGYPWGQGHFYVPRTGKACVLGQVGLNLGIFTDHPTRHQRNILDDINQALYDIGHTSLIDYNDAKATSYEDVKRFAHEVFDQYADRVIYVISPE